MVSILLIIFRETFWKKNVTGNRRRFASKRKTLNKKLPNQVFHHQKNE
jgi:hypothetical protein